MDMDLDDLLDGEPKQVSTRPSRFAPKGSKFQPKLKPKTEASSASASLQLPAPMKEDVDLEPKHEKEAVDMDVEINTAIEKQELEDNSMETEVAEVQRAPEDEIVREIEVYFSPSVDPETQLYTFQYVHRPSWRPYELEDRCEEVRVKPTSAEVEIDLAVDVDSKNYDAGADPSIKMKKQTLATPWKPPQTSGCAVGILTGNELHLNPIHSFAQLRTSLRHLDAKESKKKNSVHNNVEDPVKSEEVKPPRMSKAQKAPDKTKGSGEKTPDQTKVSVEEWVPLKYHSVTSGLAAGYLQKMLAQKGSDIYFSMSMHDYLDSLCPGTPTDQNSKVIPRSLLELPLKERFKKWLLEGPPLHRFDTLKHLAPNESIEEVLAVVQELAVLVQGLWVPKSTLVYEQDTSHKTLIRDFVLLQFSKDTVLKKKLIPRNTTTANVMKDVLHRLAKERPTCEDWKLKEPPDLDFIRHHPAVVKKQQEGWQRREKTMPTTLVPGGKTGTMPSKSTTDADLVASKSSDKLAANTSGSKPKVLMSDEVSDAIRKALQKLFKSTKTCSLQQITQRLRDMAITESGRPKGLKGPVTAANSIDSFPQELQTILSEVAVNIHGICVPKSSAAHPEYDDFRKVVIELLLAQGPNAKLKKAAIYEAAAMRLGKEPTPVAYQKVMQELCVYQASSWILKSGDSNITL